MITDSKPQPARDADAAEYARLVRRGIEIGQARKIPALEVDENMFSDIHQQDDAGQLVFFEVMK